jgi:hypothetical protein
MWPEIERYVVPAPTVAAFESEQAAEIERLRALGWEIRTAAGLSVVVGWKEGDPVPECAFEWRGLTYNGRDPEVRRLFALEQRWRERQAKEA